MPAAPVFDLASHDASNSAAPAQQNASDEAKRITGKTRASLLFTTALFRC
jgi:hypothetical protein